MSTKSNDAGQGNDASPIYKIEVKGDLDASWSDWFDGMRITREPGDNGGVCTALTGRIIDQAALHGVLARIRDLNLVLISVSQLASTPDDQL